MFLEVDKNVFVNMLRVTHITLEIVVNKAKGLAVYDKRAVNYCKFIFHASGYSHGMAVSKTFGSKQKARAWLKDNVPINTEYIEINTADFDEEGEHDS